MTIFVSIYFGMFDAMEDTITATRAPGATSLQIKRLFVP